MQTRQIISDQGDAIVDASNAIAGVLRQALETRGCASLMVSGGSSPKPVYNLLSKADLDWSKITVSLVDERWVDPGQAGSNEDFIRENLIQNKAKSASFFGLKTPHSTVADGLNDAEARFENIKKPFDVCVMGMGGDGHTASWFPNSGGLESALSLKNENVLCEIDAAGCPVAGEHTTRISLTLKAVLDAHAIILFIPSAEKRAVFDAASEQYVNDAPVKALLQAGAKLHVFTSPTT